MKASDFARWAGPHAASSENVVTAVTVVTAPHKPSISKAFDPSAEVTKAPGAMVTVVTKIEAEQTAGTAPAPAPKARLPKKPHQSRSDNRTTDSNHGNQEIEHATADREERAAIIEYDAGVPRSWAEGYARLDPNRPPADVPLRRWRQFIDDIGRFLDGGFADKAAALGWGAFDLFGCDRDKPFARIDQQGLCWLIAGNRLVDLSYTAAIVETWTGARQTWRRKPSESGRVLAWELVQ